MSTLSTPRSTRPESATGSPAEMLTPSRKVKALLEAFDSDSESENTAPVNNRLALSNLSNSALGASKNSAAFLTAEQDEDEDDEDAIVFAPRGRMAQMLGLENGKESGAQPTQPESAYERVARTLHARSASPAPVETQQARGNNSSDDELPSAFSSRRRLQKKSHESNAAPEENESSGRRSDRSESPLFVEQTEEQESNTPLAEPPNARLLALIEQKRKAREERERIEREKKAARAEQTKQFNSDILASEESDDDPGSAQKLTQQSRPTRKASKKALEEMNRETQRLSRNMQLAHEPRTKRKITKESFLAGFSFGRQVTTEQAANDAQSSTSSSSAISSDSEKAKDKGTPPTSPVRPSFDDQSDKVTAEAGLSANDEDMPSVDEIKTQMAAQEPIPVQRVEVHEKAAPADLIDTAQAQPKKAVKPVNVRLSRQDVARHQQDASDDDLEVVTSPGQCRRLAMFENIRSKHTQENQSLLRLKYLARLTSPTRRSKSMTPAELSASLRVQARQQALRERQEKIEELRAKGIIIETSEEREALEAEVEDLVEKARKEADEIARREKAAREKKSGVESESDDEDYELSGSEDEDKVENGDAIGLSSEEEDVEESEEEEEEEEDSHQNPGDWVETEANETAESEDEDVEIAQEDDQTIVTQSARRRRPMRVVSDDEDEQEEEATIAKTTAPPQEIQTPARSVALSANSAQRPHFPEMPGKSTATMSLTQAFAGTIGENDSGEGDDSYAIQSLPDPGLPKFQDMTIDSQVMVKDSQEQRRGSIDILAGYTQSNTRVSESPAPNWSQPSQFPEPTQDAGFVLTPFDHSRRFADPPASTIDTVILPEKEIESPTRRKKGRLLQRGRPVQLSDEEGDFEIKASAFDVMKKAAKHKTKTAAQFDRLNSKAKEHIDEAAEESEDEYAGLGGASDDENGEENEIDRQMINDNSGEVVDEKQLAALNADHQRTMDEKQVSKLLKDITTGALRRRRGGDDEFDLDDSDDEHLARRRAKQREFAKMRKALLADEKVSEIANNPKKSAFFKALEDRDDDDDMEIEFDNGADLPEESSQDVQKESLPSESSNKRKRPLEPAAEDATNRPAARLRRTPAAISQKPSSLAEIRQTVSFLTETPEYDSFREDASIEDDIVYDTDKGVSEDEGSTQEPERRMSTEGFAIPPNPRRTRGRVVDRLALKRAASSNSAASSHTKAAFMTGSDAFPQIGFRPPALLHRSTTSSSSTSSDSSFSTTRNSKSTTGGRAAASTKKGAVNYYTAARERERERELRMRDSGGKSAATVALLKQKALAKSSALMALSKNQWE